MEYLVILCGIADGGRNRVYRAHISVPVPGATRHEIFLDTLQMVLEEYGEDNFALTYFSMELNQL